MHSFQPIPSDLFDFSPFRMIGKEWFVITAEKLGKVNTMTAAWGGMGTMWNKDVAFIVVRDSRYTKEFLDAADTFSMTFFDKHYHSTLKYLGAVSGRDEDKIAGARLTIDYDGKTPYFDEGSTVFICRKMFHCPMKPESFLDPSIQEQFYQNNDYHTLYIAEITKILAR